MTCSIYLKSQKWNHLCEKQYQLGMKVISKAQQGVSMQKLVLVNPCQINKEFWVTSWILVKLGVFVLPMVLTTHTIFLTTYITWFLIYDHKYFEYFMKKRSILSCKIYYSSSLCYYCKTKISAIKDCCRPFHWSINYGIST